MSRKSEREFVGEGLSDDDFAALNGDGPQDAPVIDDGASTEAIQPQTDVAPIASQPPVADAPQIETEPKMVDVRALQEARAELRKRDEELRKRDEEFARADERVKLLQQAWEQQSKPAAPKVPDLLEEPLEHIDYRLKAADERFKTVEDRLEAYEKADAARIEQAKVERQQQALIGEADAVLAAAGTKHADVNDAFEFAVKGLRQEVARVVASQGLTGHQAGERFDQYMRNEQLRLAQQCPRDPDQAAEFVRRNARWWGWTGPQAQTQQQPTVGQPAAQVQQPTIQQRAEQQNRHMSLSGVTGAEPPKTLDAKAIAALPDKDFNELLKTAAGRKLLEKEFGGY